MKENAPKTNVRPTDNPIIVGTAGGQRLSNTHDCDIIVPTTLEATARRAHILPGLATESLIGISPLVDAGCTVLFDDEAVHVIKNNTTIWKGWRDPINRLWRLPLKPLQHEANNAYQSSTISELLAFLHAAAYSPVKSTWMKAINKGFFNTWPGLNQQNVRKYLEKSIASEKGHMDEERAGTRSTKIKDPRVGKGMLWDDQEDITAIPSQEIGNERTHHIYAAVEPIPETGQIHTDQTGRFPVISSRGNKYIMIMYVYDANAIMSTPMKNRTKESHTEAYRELHQQLVKKGLRPKMQRLDNEASKMLKEFMTSESVDYQLVPAHIHRRNAAERCIRTWKNHFIAGLASTDDNFPMHLWCRLLRDVDDTLNMLRPSRLNPTLSAFTQLHGAFDFNRTPMAPPGCKVLIHEKPNQRTTFGAHGVEGWNLGRHPDGYRCYRVYVTSTRSERNPNRVEFFPQHTKVPFMSTADAATKAATDLIDILKHPTPPTTYPHLGDEKMKALNDLADIFNTTIETPTRLPRVQPTIALPPLPIPVPAPTILPASPRVIAPTTITPPTSPKSHRASAPRVQKPTPVTPEKIHRYPTRNQSNIALAIDKLVESTNHRAHLAAEHSAHHVATINNNTDLFENAEINTVPTNWANAIVDDESGEVLEYRHLIKREKYRKQSEHSFANEIGRLAQGVGGREKGTDTIFFIPHSQVPSDRKKDVTYGRICVNWRPQKAEPLRTRLTVGGNLIKFPGDVGTPTAEMTTTKVLINSTISTKNAKFLTVDLKNFYLNTPMARFEYMKIPIDILPQEIIIEYGLDKLVHNGFIYCEIRKGMYGLPQAGIIANQLLEKRLATHGYHPTPITPGLWKHETRPITFSLVVDDFGIKYVGKQHADHLIKALEQDYKCDTNWDGDLYCGLTIKWDYIKRTADLSMPGYIQKVLHKFQHPYPKKPQHAPHKCETPQYGAKVQYTETPDNSPHLVASEIKTLQQQIGSLLYYARAVDSTLLVALSTVASKQSQGTQAVAEAMSQILDYCATHPDATIRYKSSDMILAIHSDASYLSVTKARSRAGGHFFLTNKKTNDGFYKNNGAILSNATIIKNVMSSAAEAEVGATYNNAREAIPIRSMLIEMNHQQPPTPIQTDNSTADGIINKTIVQKRSKAIDMRFYWLRDREQQNQFHIFWKPGKTNLGDYHTKHHPASHHQAVRPIYLHCKNNKDIKGTTEAPSSDILRGCVKPVPRKLVAVAALAQLLIPHLNLHVTKPGSRRSADSHVRRHTQQMCAKRHT